jgi:hypothetical protein
MLLVSCASVFSETLTPTPNKNLAATPSIPVILTQTSSPTLIFGLTREAIKGYLAAKVGLSSFSGRLSCPFQLLGTSNENTETPGVFVWVLCQEYRSGKTLSKGTGMSLPLALFLRKTENGYAIASHKIPGDGTNYGPDIRAIFPENTWDLIFGKNAQTYNLRVQMLEYEAEGDALDYFGLTTPGAIRPTYTPVR